MSLEEPIMITNPEKTPFPLNKEVKFYGVDCDNFKVGSQVFVALEDPSDGYRSYLEAVEVVDKEAAKLMTFFKKSIDTVKIVEYNDGEFTGYKLVSTTDGHVWLEFGTDYTDDYYPCFIFYYNPRKK
jgi:hypothetical protein